MKIDIIGQITLLITLLLFGMYIKGIWLELAMIILILWQIVSALHLYIHFRYNRKKDFLQVAILVLCSLPWLLNVKSGIGYVPLLVLIAWYFYATLRDTVKVYNRPRSFWDLV